MRLWTIQYLWKNKDYELTGMYHPGNVGDWVYLWGDIFKIVSLRYFPEKGICCVDLTKLL